jgi:hypothetical protein
VRIGFYVTGAAYLVSAFSSGVNNSWLDWVLRVGLFPASLVLSSWPGRDLSGGSELKIVALFVAPFLVNVASYAVAAWLFLNLRSWATR